MCGRFSLEGDPDALAAHFRLETIPPNVFDRFRSRYNVAPGQDVVVIWDDRDGGRTASMRRWGLVPPWAKDPRIAYKMINARSETAAEKPSFRSAFRRRRCLIPASGFYEWRREGKQKVPHHIRLRSGEPFAFAGLWESWQPAGQGGGSGQSRQNGQSGDAAGTPLLTCTILTVAPNELVSRIHDRMPVILPPEAHDDWLDPDAEADFLKAMLRSYPADDMEMYEVSPVVNSAKNDVPECVQRKS